MESLFTLCRMDPHDGFIKEPIEFLQRTIVTLFQEVEWLTDHQATAALAERPEWRYALHLPLQHGGLQAYEFCFFRQKLWKEPAALARFQGIRERVAGLHLWTHRLVAADSPTHSIAFICRLNQTSWFAEAFGQALAALAASQPDWLRQVALPHWYIRYASSDSGKADLPILGGGNLPLEAVRADITSLLDAVALAGDAALAQLPEIRRLQRTWQQSCNLYECRNHPCVLCSRCVVGANIAGEPA
jgi:transposase